MADENENEGLTAEELEAQSGEALPDREAMSVVWIEPDVLPPPEKDMPIDYSIDNAGPIEAGE